MEWTTLTMQVTTPLFNGGADPDGGAGFTPDDETGVRPASIRGAMRFWFRALAGTLAGPDLLLLSALERQVFGGIADQPGQQSAQASPLILRVPEPPRPSLDVPFPQGSDGRWIGYLLGLGLMKPGPQGVRLLRPCVPPGADPFELKIGFRHDRRTDPKAAQAIEALAVMSLWLACAYGGLGSRVRRGFGGMRIVAASGALPRPWTPTAVLTPGPELYRDAGWVWPWSAAATFGIFEGYLRDLIEAVGSAAGTPDSWEEPPPYPVLSKTHSPAVLVQKHFGSWEEALAFGGKQLRLFRANRPDPGARRQRARVTTAEWHDVVNGGSADFPLGALGLPVGYQDRRTERKFTVNAGVPAGPRPDELRRASPLWIRPVGSGQSWRLLTFAFRTRFLPEQARTYLLPDQQAVPDGRPRELNTNTSDVERLTAQWLETMRVGGDFTSVIRS